MPQIIEETRLDIFKWERNISVPNTSHHYIFDFKKCSVFNLYQCLLSTSTISAFKSELFTVMFVCSWVQMIRPQVRRKTGIKEKASSQNIKKNSYIVSCRQGPHTFRRFDE